MLDIEPERITADDLTADEDGELAIVAESFEDPASFEPFVDSFIAGAAEGGPTSPAARRNARSERSRPTRMRRRSWRV